MSTERRKTQVGGFLEEYALGGNGSSKREGQVRWKML